MVILVRSGMKRSNYYVGIFPTINTSLDNPYDDTSLVVESYIKRIYESNSIPICIFLENGEINYRLLEMCDAFILPGGHRINACVYKVLAYARINKKPVLGICMGMQAMSIYSVIIDMLNDNYNEILFKECYDKQKENNPVLVPVKNENIHKRNVKKNNFDDARHCIIVKDKSILSTLTNQCNVISLHGYMVSRIGKIFKIGAISEDGVIEAIESNISDLLWLGVQFHPELEDNNTLIVNFINLAKKQKNKH